MTGSFNLTALGGHTGSAPSPFDAQNGPRLAGLSGSHPLQDVRAEELVRPTDGAVLAEFVLDHPARVGEGIEGTVRLRATERVAGRKAALRLVGLRLDEERRSREERNSQGQVTRTEDWVEAQGRLFSEEAFLDPAVPNALVSGQTWEARFAVPAPRLGPPTAHLGEALIAWALEIRWDVAMGSDHFVAMYLPVAQHPDLLRAGVGEQGGTSLMTGVPVGDAVINVTSPLPVPSGSEMVVTATWPSAPGGKKARVELHRRTNAPNGVEGVIASLEVPPQSLADGSLQARLTVPAGSPPSFDGAGLQLGYVIRILVDRRFQTDAAIERPVAIV
ncbi:MAG: hypothetical protein QOH61_622 [Chloroflexota bacterium]|jgi:hypothetical protein|nr:hypothetical protein [Chloroflexota bacterium]